MALVFTSTIHQEAFNRVQGVTSGKSFKTAVYLLTSIPRIAHNIEDYISGDYIIVDKLESLNLSTGERVIVAIALNIYNGYVMDDVSLNPYDVFSYLDEDYREVLVTAMNFRFVA